MTNEDFENVYYPRYQSVIKAIARKMARGDSALCEDLCQEGAVKLWKLQPEKAKTNPDAWIRRALQLGMIDYLRRTHPDRYCSLDQLLEAGAQLEAGDDDTVRVVRATTEEKGS